MNKYDNGKIYKIICDTDDIYVGSTIQKLRRRLHRHICSPMKSTKNILKQNPKIVLLEDYPCDSRRELLKKEREWIDKLKCVNNDRPLITYQEKLEYNRSRQKKLNRTEYNRYRKEWRDFISGWGYNHYLGTSLNLLDIDLTLFT